MVGCFFVAATAMKLVVAVPLALAPLAVAGLREGSPRSLYVHLPFCRRRCFYCDFPVVVAGEASEKRSDATESYVALLDRELRSQRWKTGPALEAVYFGGGTPSLVDPERIGFLLDRVRATAGVADGAEVTIECDPGTFDAARLRAYQGVGITRVSLGVQSLDDGVLEAAGRAHRRKDALEAIRIVKDADLAHGWSLDLISGLPGLDRDLWRQTLEEALTFEPPHVSSYDLQVEDGTAFGKWYGDEAPPSRRRKGLPDEEAAADMYRDASRVLRSAGYVHYEISSYARSPEKVARHNSLYWAPRASWLALGLGATSSKDGSRFTRPRAMADYEAWVDDGASVEGGDDDDDDEDWLLDELLTALRTSDGVDLGRVRRVYGADAEACVRRGAADAVEANLATLHGDALRLTDPDGFLFSNFVISTIFAAFDDA